MSNCLNCGKEITQTKGKRAKKTCSDTCRQTYWQKKNKKGKKYVNILFDDWMKLFGSMKPVMAMDENGNQRFFEYKSEGDGSIIEVPAAAGKSVTVTIKSENHFKPQEDLKTQKQDNLPKEENKGAGEAENKPEVDNSDILAQIKAIEKEKVPDHRNTSWGKKSWLIEQQKRIKELKLKL